MNLLAPVEMDIDDFNVGNVNNYNDVRGHTMSSNKAASRTVSMSSSKALEDYATRVEHLNNILCNEETRKPINSSQLSYTEQGEIEIQVSRATNHENKVRKQWGIENAPVLKSTLVQHVDDDVINIQLPYDPNNPIEPKLWDGNFHPISLHGSIEHLASNTKNIRDSLNYMAKYIGNKQIDSKRSNDMDDLKDIGEAV